MTSIIVLCAIKFLTHDPIPPMLEDIYKTNYSCEKFQPLQKELATDKIENVNKYFPAKRPSWPLIINPLDQKSEQIAKEWIDEGVIPGFLLPDKKVKNPELFQEIEKLRKAGAIPIAPLKDRLKSTLESKRYYWCMHGLCPAGWYIEDGIDEVIELLPKGLYISAPHWYEKPNLPIPDRMINLNGKEILPWTQIKVLNNDDNKTNQSVMEERSYFTPTIQEHWNWLGVDFYYKQDKIATNLIGRIMLDVGKLSFWMWDRFHLININLFSLINENFSWIAVLIAIFNIILLVISIIRRKGTAK